MITVIFLKGGKPFSLIKMEEFYLAVLSEFNHQEGYLKIALDDLVGTGLACE